MIFGLVILESRDLIPLVLVEVIMGMGGLELGIKPIPCNNCRVGQD